MARKTDPSLKTEQGEYNISRVGKGGMYKAKIEANSRWEKNNPQDKIMVRVPQGCHELIKEYVKRKASEEPTNLKYNSYNGKAYQPSVNALIKHLLAEETGIKLD